MKTNWPTKRLGEVADYINGRAFKPAEWGESGLPIIRIQNLTETQEKFNYFKGNLEDKYLVKNGDILLSWSASLGVYVWDKGNAVLNQHIFKVVSHKDINKNYLFYALVIAVEELKRRVHGSTMTHVTKPIFNRVTICVPPLPIQKQIVERMDKIAEARKLNDELIQKSDKLFQSLLHQELNSNDKNWEVKKLEKIVDINYGKGLDKSYRKEGGKYYAYGSNGPIYRTDEILIEELAIIVGRKGGAGLLWMTREPSWPIDTTFYLRVKDGHNTDLNFLYFFLQTKNLPKLAIVTAVPGINRSTLYNVKISLPPIKEQKQIVAKLSAVQEYKKQLLEQKLKLKELFDTVLHKSMNGGLIN